MPKMEFVGQKFEHVQDRQTDTQTDATENINTSHSRISRLVIT